jgi:hypothetical protein
MSFSHYPSKVIDGSRDRESTFRPDTHGVSCCRSPLDSISCSRPSRRRGWRWPSQYLWLRLRGSARLEGSNSVDFRSFPRFTSDSRRQAWPLSGSCTVRALGRCRTSLPASSRDGRSRSAPDASSRTGCLIRPKGNVSRVNFVSREILQAALLGETDCMACNKACRLDRETRCGWIRSGSKPKVDSRYRVGGKR